MDEHLQEGDAEVLEQMEHSLDGQRERSPSRRKEEMGIVLDYLPNGYPFDNTPSHRKNAIVQALGKNHFTLLELVPKKGIGITPNEEVYIGDGKRDKIHHILGKLPVNKLTSTAKNELEFVVKDMVEKEEKRFENFEDVRKRVKLLPDPKKVIIKRILSEILGNEKHKLFID